MKQTLSQFMCYQRKRVAEKYLPVRFAERTVLLQDDLYEGPADVDNQMEFEYRRGIAVAGGRV